MARSPRWLRRPDERPRELLDAALSVFSATGYRATRLEQVADAAGVTKGAIYHYFTDKEDLLTQALLGRIEAVFADIEAAARDTTGTPADRLLSVLRAGWSRWRLPQTARLQHLLMGEVRTELPAVFEAAMRAGPWRVRQLVSDLLREGQHARVFDDGFDADALARVVVAGLMHQGLLVGNRAGPGHGSTAADQAFDSAMRVFLRGIASVGPPEHATVSYERTRSRRRNR